MSYLDTFVNTGSRTHAGLASVQRALATGWDHDRIRQASNNEGFIFADKAQQYMNQVGRSSTIQNQYQKQFAELQERMASQQTAYNSQLQQMTNTIQESQAQTKAALMAANQTGTKESVLGVKSATAKDSPGIKKLNRAGMKGSFNRQGLRIKGLNVG